MNGPRDSARVLWSRTAMGGRSRRRTSASAVRLHPLLITRIAHAGLGLAVAAVAAARDGSLPPASGLPVLGVVAGLVLAVRGYGVGVRWDGEILTVFGWFRSRTILRDQIVEITGTAVRWVAPGGRRRWTPLTAFWSSEEQLAVLRRHHARCLSRLRAWAYCGSQVPPAEAARRQGPVRHRRSGRNR